MFRCALGGRTKLTNNKTVQSGVSMNTAENNEG